MRRIAFAAILLTLTLAGIGLDVIHAHRHTVQPLTCSEVVTVVEPAGDRMTCLSDPMLAPCHGVRPGFRYRGCTEVGPMPGAVLLMRGLPLSASRASAADFAALPRIGPGLAARIVSARTHGPFCRIDDLRRVRGIGAKRAGIIGPHLTFDDPLCAKRQGPVDSGRR